MTEKQAGLRFDIYERVHLSDELAGIKEMDEIELLPQIQVRTEGEQAVLNGNLWLTGKYVGDDGEQLQSLEHFIPVEITLPMNRVSRMEEIAVEIENFDFELLSSRSINVTGVLSLEGIELLSAESQKWREEEEVVFVHEVEEAYGDLSPRSSVHVEEAYIPRGQQEAHVEQDQEDTRAVQEQLDTRAEQGQLDTRAEQGQLDTRAEQGQLDTRAEQGQQDTRAEQEQLDTRAEQEQQDAQAEQEQQDTQAEQEQEQTSWQRGSQEELPVSEPKAEAFAAFAGERQTEPQPMDPIPDWKAQIDAASEQSWRPPEARGRELPVPNNAQTENREQYATYTPSVSELLKPAEEALIPIEQADEKKEMKIAVTSKPTGQFEHLYHLKSIALQSEQRGQGGTETLPKPEPRDTIEWHKLLAAGSEQQFRKVKMCIVQKEETLEKIAERYQINPREISLYNRLGTQGVAEGQVIYIP